MTTTTDRFAVGQIWATGANRLEIRNIHTDAHGRTWVGGILRKPNGRVVTDRWHETTTSFTESINKFGWELVTEAPTMRPRSMSDVDVMFTEAVLAWEADGNRAPLDEFRATYPTLFDADRYDEILDEYLYEMRQGNNA